MSDKWTTNPVNDQTVYAQKTAALLRAVATIPPAGSETMSAVETEQIIPGRVVKVSSVTGCSSLRRWTGFQFE